MVVPLMLGHGYTFIAVKSMKPVETAYEVVGAPRNILIDREGRLISRQQPLGTADHERRLESWVEVLLGDGGEPLVNPSVDPRR